jgi:membrane associated rhomboid family serine protease
LLIPISTEHEETTHPPLANLSIIAVTCVVSLALMGELPRAALAASAAEDGPLLFADWFRHLCLVRGNVAPQQLLGSTLMHADWFHLAGNMFLLLALGNPVNARLGQLRYLALYAGAAVMGGIAWLLFGEHAFLVGASGAICGVAAAFLVLFPLTRVNVLFPLTAIVVALVATVLLVAGVPIGARLFVVLASLVACTVASLLSVADRSPPEGCVARVMGFWSVPLPGCLVVLWYLGWDVVAIACDLGGRIAHEAHLGGALVGAALAVGLALTGAARGTPADPTLLELASLVKPARPRAAAPAPRRHVNAVSLKHYHLRRAV